MVLVPLHATPTNQPPPLTPTRCSPNGPGSGRSRSASPLQARSTLLAGGAPPPGDRWPVRRSFSFLLGGLGRLPLPRCQRWTPVHGAFQRPHRAAHDLDDGGSHVSRPGGASHPRIADPVQSTAPHAARRVALAVGPGVHRSRHSRSRFSSQHRLRCTARRSIVSLRWASACVSASPLPHHWLPVMWPLVGIDPVPRRISYPLRLLVLFLMLPFHAFLGISIMS